MCVFTCGRHHPMKAKQLGRWCRQGFVSSFPPAHRTLWERPFVPPLNTLRWALTFLGSLWLASTSRSTGLSGSLSSPRLAQGHPLSRGSEQVQRPLWREGAKCELEKLRAVEAEATGWWTAPGTSGFHWAVCPVPHVPVPACLYGACLPHAAAAGGGSRRGL